MAYKKKKISPKPAQEGFALNLTRIVEKGNRENNQPPVQKGISKKDWLYSLLMVTVTGLGLLVNYLFPSDNGLVILMGVVGILFVTIMGYEIGKSHIGGKR